MFFFKGFKEPQEDVNLNHRAKSLYTFNPFNINQQHKSGLELPSGFITSLPVDGRVYLWHAKLQLRSAAHLHDSRGECRETSHVTSCLDGQTYRQTQLRPGQAAPGRDERRDTQWNDGNPLTRHCLVTTSQRAAGTNIRLPASMRSVNRLPALFTFLILSLSAFMAARLSTYSVHKYDNHWVIKRILLRFNLTVP